ncbi:MAG: PilW family protein [bacterium]|jgi:type IV pilus assembly protein PilW
MAPRMYGRQHGVSLVELMIGITIALILTFGLMVMIMGTSRGYKSQDDFARLQENGMTALSFIGDAIRHAGFYGVGNAATPVDATAGNVTTTDDCGSAANPPSANWALNTLAPMVGFTGLTPTTVNATLPCVLATNFQAGQVLALRMATGERLRDPNNDGNLSDAAFVANRIYVQGNATGAILFRGSDYGTLRGASLTRRIFGGADAPIFEYQAYLYYIRPCSRPASPPGCQATDDDGRPIPTLVRQELEGASMVERPLVQGVELVDFLYGLDANGDGVPDRFTAAPAGGDWATVVVVRVSVLVRDSTGNVGFDDTGKLYDLNGDGVPDFTCTPNVNCTFRRRVFTQNFQVRNVAQRRGA